MSSISFFLKKIRQRAVCFAQILAIVLAEKSNSRFFWSKNLFFNLFLTQNTLEIMINLSMTPKNNPKNQTQPETNNQLELIYIYIYIYVFSRAFKKQKYLIWTPLIKWNNLTQISFILVD